eukprot:5042276-Prymnesium_polylepis.1
MPNKFWENSEKYATRAARGCAATHAGSCGGVPVLQSRSQAASPLPGWASVRLHACTPAGRGTACAPTPTRAVRRAWLQVGPDVSSLRLA